MESIDQSEIPAYVRVSATEARMLFLAVRCWQDAQKSGNQVADGLSVRLEKIIAEFDLVFGGPQVH
jgi:hypothetical protein